MKAAPPPVAAIMLAGVLALTGCGTGGEVVDAGEVLVLVGEKGSDSADALLSGTLTNVHGCVGVNDTVVIWPHGTKVTQRQPLTLQIPGVGPRSIGDSVDIGGGVFLDQFPVPRNVGAIQVAGITVPPECTRQNVWIGS